MLALPTAVAVSGYAVAALLSEAKRGAVRVALVAGWISHAVAIAVDATGVGTLEIGARFGFAPALSVTAWLVMAVYLVEGRMVPVTAPRSALAILCICTLVLAWIFPGELRPHATSHWAPLHWVLGIASYGLFGAAVLHAALLNRADRQMRSAHRHAAAVGSGDATSRGLPLLRLERLTFQFVLAGFCLLTATVVIGWWTADPWRWDHKAVFSILGWAVFAALLIGRQAFGWRGRHATRWLYSGAGLLLLAYVGSRFVLEVILHRVPA